MLREKGRAFIQWGKSFFVSEEGPSSGDPTETPETQAAVNSLSDPAAQIAALQERAARTLEAGETLGKVGTVAGEAYLEVAAGDVGDFTAAATGTTVTGQKLTRKERAIATVLAVVPFVAASWLRSGERVAEPADEVADAGAAQNRITEPSRLLSSGGETNLTREQVARFRGTGQERGAAFEQFLREAHGGTPGAPTRTQLGTRIHDVGGIQQRSATELVIEGKNYLRYRTVGGEAIRGEVPLTREIQGQLYKDALWVREGRKAGVHRVVQWDFAGAGPSPDLEKALQRWGLPYVQ